MIIRLHELGKDGRSFSFTEETEELESSLADYLQGQSFIIEFFLRPLSSKTFEMKGHFVTKVPSVCSKCSEDFMIPVDTSFHEILVQPQPEDRTGKYAKTPLASDETLSSYEYSPDLTFNAGEYFHELLGITLPSYPKHSESEKEICLQALHELGVDIEDPEAEVELGEKPSSPFNVLQNLKLS
jgi:uncharacterized protein